VRQFLVDHGEKVLGVIILAACLYFIAVNLRAPSQEDFRKLKENAELIASGLEKNTVRPNWPDTQVDYLSWFQQKVGEIPPVAEHVRSWEVYPQPQRPKVNLKPEEVVVEMPAVLSPPEAFRIKADQGCVGASCVPPKDLRFFYPVRIEIYRGSSPDKVEQKVHEFVLGPEEEVVALPVPGGEGATPTAEPPPPVVPPERTTEAAGTTARSAKTDRGKPGPKDKAKKPSDLLVFEDTQVSPDATYWYKARLIARLAKLEPNGQVLVGNQKVRVKLPENLARVPGSKEGVTLYASPWTDLAHDTVPPNYLVRFAGAIGEPPPQEDLRRPASGYGGNFAVRYWIQEERAWGQTTVPVEVGKPIAGRARFSVQGKARDFAFDSGLTFERIRRGTSVSVKMIKVVVTKKEVDPETGQPVDVPVLDPAGIPIMKEVPVEQRVPIEVAVLNERATGKTLLYPLSSEFPPYRDLKIVFPGEEEPGAGTKAP
jgi:hypothetical protein